MRHWSDRLAIANGNLAHMQDENKRLHLYLDKLEAALVGLSHNALGECWCPGGGPITETHELYCSFAREAMGVEPKPAKVSDQTTTGDTHDDQPIRHRQG